MVVGILGINLFWGFLKCHSGCCCLSVRRACVKAISSLLHCNWLLLYNGRFFCYNAQSFFIAILTFFLCLFLSVPIYGIYRSVCLSVSFSLHSLFSLQISLIISISIFLSISQSLFSYSTLFYICVSISSIFLFPYHSVSHVYAQIS